MMQSVWLKNLITVSLGKPDNILYFSHKNLLEMFRTEDADLWLYEPDGQPGLGLSFRRGRISELPAKDASLPLKEIRGIQGCRVTPQGLVLPLRHGETDFFGAIVLPDVQSDAVSADGKKVVDAFGNALYREAMGAILQSFFPKILEIRGLEMSYDSRQQVLKGVDLDICESEFTVILGSSGCGKTTLMNIVGGMLTPTAGEVLWQGQNVAAMKERELTAYRGNSIGFVFQHYNLIPDLTARENIEVATSFVKSPMSASEALAYVGLENMEDRYPGKLSGGQQQRICIARAIAKRARVLLCDEPTGALDPENSVRVVRLLKQLVTDEGIAVVMITHNTAFAALADHCVVMSNGRIIEDVRQPFPLSADALRLR